MSVGEINDAQAALDWLRSRYPGLPYTLAGCSFGSRVVVNPVGALATCSAKKIFIQSTHDEHGSPPEMEAFCGQVAEPKHLVWVEAQDHFFAGGLDTLESEIMRCVQA